MEFMTEGTVKKQIKKDGKLHETLVHHYTKQILEGVCYLHENKIVHRDIKNENILRDCHNNVKLCDFGISKQLQIVCGKSNQNNTVSQGSYFFMAPEVINRSGYGRKADMWSLACTIVEMLTGYPPWAKPVTPYDTMYTWCVWLYNVGINAVANYDLPEGVSLNMKNFLKSLFSKDPNLRPTAKQALSVVESFVYK